MSLPWPGLTGPRSLNTLTKLVSDLSRLGESNPRPTHYECFPLSFQIGPLRTDTQFRWHLNLLGLGWLCRNCSQNCYHDSLQLHQGSRAQSRLVREGSPAAHLLVKLSADPGFKLRLPGRTRLQAD
jgi:hypothetical protein